MLREKHSESSSYIEVWNPLYSFDIKITTFNKDPSNYYILEKVKILGKY